MSALEYCQTKTAPPGSELHYILLFCPPEQRAALLGLYCCYQHIRDCIEQMKEPAIASHKLHWWRQELDRTFAGQAQHPATQLLAPALQHTRLTRALFDEWLDAALNQLEYDVFPDQNSRSLFCQRQLSSLFVLVAELMAYSDPAGLTALRQLGELVQQVQFLQRLPQDLLRGQLYLPLDLLEQHQLSPEALLQAPASHWSQLRPLLYQQAQQLQSQFEDLGKTLANTDVARLYPLLAQAKFSELLLQQLQRRQFPDNQLVRLWPLPMLWHCWRLKTRT